MEDQSPPERPWASISIDHLIFLTSSLDQTSSSTTYNLLSNVMLQYGKPQIIRSEIEHVFSGEIMQWISEVEGILREFSALSHSQSTELVEKSSETIPDVAKRWD